MFFMYGSVMLKGQIINEFFFFNWPRSCVSWIAMTCQTSSPNPDITGRSDIETLVNHFYNRVRSDELIGFIFEEVAKTNWEAHLPRMYAFWETVLFGTGGFTGNPMAVHARLVPQTEMGRPQFDRWLTLFRASVDDLFSGDKAAHIKSCAEDMANVIYSRINQVPDPRFDPAKLTAEQRERYHRYRVPAATAVIAWGTWMLAAAV
jgi:hemoglobin